MKLGRNQKIGIIMWAVGMLLTFGYMVFGAFMVPEDELPTVLSSMIMAWASFAVPFTAICMGIILGGSAGIKISEAFARAKAAPATKAKP